ncbi:MAG: CRISPR-associated endonuclease Cas1 [Candidatus Methanomethylicota archaeon]|uniref:CRISPR-associated endonuclease Cas1 n=1 Tax=Thermoproteota archaeon TaxID=2056631 RepID=A0A497ENZ9_9CREN|nr:MAG: CRISPR-associated endonuclease Cas1 [Candidatus Verstraetearchaeota archaeon]
MKVLVVGGYGVKLGYSKGMVTIRGPANRELPISNFDQIILTTSGISISSRLIREAVKRGVDIIVLDGKGDVIARVDSPCLSATTLTRRGQYEAYRDWRGAQIAKSVAYAKITNQANLLKYYAKSRGIWELRKAADAMVDIAEQVKQVNATAVDLIREDLIKYEAQAAKIYWSHVVQLIPPTYNFVGRDQDSCDQFNLMLNYGYGILRATIWRLVILAGLDPHAGYLHVDKSGRPSLVLDLMEEFRPTVVDKPLIALTSKLNPEHVVDEGKLTVDARNEVAKAVLSRLKDKVRVGEHRVELEVAIKRRIRSIARLLRGFERECSGYVERW